MGIIAKFVGINKRSGQHSKGDPDMVLVNDLKNLFKKARKSVRIISGRLPYDIYCENGLMPLLESASARGVVTQILTGPDGDDDSIAKIQSLGGEVYKLPEHPEIHFALVDGRDAKIEEPHLSEYDPRVQWVIDDYKYSELLNKSFEEMLRHVLLLGEDDVVS